jgi:hypothetical protein
MELKLIVPGSVPRAKPNFVSFIFLNHGNSTLVKGRSDTMFSARIFVFSYSCRIEPPEHDQEPKGDEAINDHLINLS